MILIISASFGLLVLATLGLIREIREYKAICANDKKTFG